MHRRPIVLYTYVYAAIATKPVHGLQMHPILHNYRETPPMPQIHIQVRAVVWNKQTAMINMYFTSATPHVKCNNKLPSINVGLTALA